MYFVARSTYRESLRNDIESTACVAVCVGGQAVLIRRARRQGMAIACVVCAGRREARGREAPASRAGHPSYQRNIYTTPCVSDEISPTRRHAHTPCPSERLSPDSQQFPPPDFSTEANLKFCKVIFRGIWPAAFPTAKPSVPAFAPAWLVLCVWRSLLGLLRFFFGAFRLFGVGDFRERWRSRLGRISFWANCFLVNRRSMRAFRFGYGVSTFNARETVFEADRRFLLNLAFPHPQVTV